MALSVTYLVLWQMDIYVYVFTVLGGGVVCFGTFTGLLLYRVARRRTPYLDGPAIAVLAAMIFVHLVALNVLRQVNWG